MPSSPFFVGLDVGGTTMKAAVVDDSGKMTFDESRKASSNNTEPDRGQDEGLKTMVKTIEDAISAAKLKRADIAAIGVVTPGLMDIPNGIILDPPNLKPWRNVRVLDYLKQAFAGTHVIYQNDGNAAAFGEYWIGAAQGVSSLAMFTLGTGVGGGIVLNGDILTGVHSHGAELGHLRIDRPDTGRLCGCGARGCLEAYASATSIVKRAREAMATWRGPTELQRFYSESDEGFEAKDVFDLALAGDECAINVCDETAYFVALGACALIATIDPDVIVIGGGVVQTKYPFVEKIDEYVRRFGLRYPVKTNEYAEKLGISTLPKPVVVTKAGLLHEAGIVGAAGYARHQWMRKQPA